MNALGMRIARMIEVQGPLSIAQFMTIALHDPQGGYYATRDPFGTDGDFITAPEISQMFGELLGLWIVQCWHDQGKPQRARLVELGPGRGTLMADALRAAKLVPEFLKAIEVVLIEASPKLREIQQERLKHSGVSVRWSDRFDESLADRPLFLLGNEFFDALPIRQFVKKGAAWYERMVTADSETSLSFALSPVATLLSVPQARGAAEDGAVFETAPSATALTEEIAHGIAAHGGAALIVDYGYGAQAGFGETLQAIGKHSFAQVLQAPGESDLSAHVDFGALADAARAAGAQVFGPFDQGAFLESLGIGPRLESLTAANPNAAEVLQKGVERLTDPNEMGTLFKAMAILPKEPPVKVGF